MTRGAIGLMILVLGVGGCGDVELSRPKQRQMEPDRKKSKARTRPPSTASSRVAKPSPQVPSKMDAAEAARVIQDDTTRGPVVDRAISALQSDGAQSRTLGRLLIQSAKPMLRARGAKLLGHVGQPATDGAKLEKLLVSDGAVEVKLGAAEGLGRMGAYRSIPALIEAMTHDQLKMRHTAYEAITLMSGFRYPFSPEGTAKTRKRQVDKFRDTVMTIRGRAAATYKKRHGKFAY